MKDVSVETVETLINDARQGSGSGLGRLLEFFCPALTNMASHEVSGELSCRMSQADLVQDTMLTASRDFAAFQGASEPEFRTWIIEIFQSRLVDGLRRHRVAERRRQQLEVQVSGSQFVDKTASASELAMLDEEAAKLLIAVQNLPNDHRDILSKRYFDDMTFEEIAEIKGASIVTVWRRWSEAIVILKRTLR